MARKRIFSKLAVSVVMGLVVMVAVVAAIIASQTPRQTPAPVRRSALSVPRQQAPAFPVIDLSQVRWVDYHGYELPVSAVAGPRDTAYGFASGFTDTPLGALLAAIDIATRAAYQFGPVVFEPTIDNQVIGQYQPEMLTDDSDEWDAAGQQFPQGAARAQLAGFAWEEYTPAVATIDLAESADGTCAATEIQVQWGGGDWKLVAPPGGDWGNASTQIYSLAGYTLFPGQGG